MSRLWRECKAHILPRVRRRLPPRKEITKIGRILSRRDHVIANLPAKLTGIKGGPMSFWELVAYHRANGTLAAFLASFGWD